MPSDRLHSAPVLALLLVVTAGCRDVPTAPGPAQLEVVIPPPAAGLPGLPLLDTVVVRLVDSVDHQPRAGVGVRWSIAQGTGSVVVLDSTTDQHGLARALWTLGGAGSNQLRAVSVDGSALTFTSLAGAFSVDRLVSNIEGGCGILTGSLWCWGVGFWEHPSGPSDRLRAGWSNAGPALLDDTHGFVDLSLSARSVCGLDSRGAVWCTHSTAPVAPVAGLPPLWALTAGQTTGTAHCGLAVADSTAWCFVPDSAAPVHLPNSAAFLMIRMEQVNIQSFFYETCGLRVDSTVACWATGNSHGLAPPDTAVALPGGLRFIDLAKGKEFGCGRTSLQALYCWGSLFVGFQPYSPVLALDDAAAVGALDDWVQVPHRGTIAQWFADDELAPTSFQPVPLGLEDLLPVTYATNALGCLISHDPAHDGGVYCLPRFWTGTTILSVEEYAPVPPPRQSGPANP